MKFPKLSLVRFAKSHEVKGSILIATVRRNPSGLYFVSILVEIDVQELPKTGSSVGVDAEWKDFAILSDGTKHENSKWFHKIEKKVVAARRSLSRRQEQAMKQKKSITRSKKLSKQKNKSSKTT